MRLTFGVCVLLVKARPVEVDGKLFPVRQQKRATRKWPPQSDAEAGNVKH